MGRESERVSVQQSSLSLLYYVFITSSHIRDPAVTTSQPLSCWQHFCTALTIFMIDPSAAFVLLRSLIHVIGIARGGGSYGWPARELEGVVWCGHLTQSMPNCMRGKKEERKKV